MATMELTQIYLEREQKKGLQARAKANGTKVAEEVRRAVDAYLAGISPEDLRLLDEGTRRAARHLADMAVELDGINARLDAAFAELSSKRGGSDPKHKHGTAICRGYARTLRHARDAETLLEQSAHGVKPAPRFQRLRA